MQTARLASCPLISRQISKSYVSLASCPECVLETFQIPCLFSYQLSYSCALQNKISRQPYRLNKEVILPLGIYARTIHTLYLESTLIYQVEKQKQKKFFPPSNIRSRMGFLSLPQGANTCLAIHKRCFSSLFFIINNSTLWQKCTFFKR